MIPSSTVSIGRFDPFPSSVSSSTKLNENGILSETIKSRKSNNLKGKIKEKQ